MSSPRGNSASDSSHPCLVTFYSILDRSRFASVQAMHLYVSSLAFICSLAVASHLIASQAYLRQPNLAGTFWYF